MEYLRLCGSFVVSLITTLIAYKLLLPRFRALSLNQSVSEYSLKEFKDKPITPTLGGIIFLVISIIISMIFNFDRLHDQGTLLVIIAFIGYGIIGFIDDFKIIKEGKNQGLTEIQKLVMQFGLAMLFYWIYLSFGETSLSLPFVKEPLHLGWLFAVLVLFMFVGASNAVNLTDGMDGLASGTSIIALVPFVILSLNQQQNALAVFLTSLIGSLLGYLYYNKKPAQIMMGDVGSLSLGGVFAATALVLKHELLLIIIGIVFVLETLSVIIQISSVKLFKRRVFPFTPIHYSFTIKGVSEKDTVHLFYLVGLIGAVIGLLLGR